LGGSIVVGRASSRGLVFEVLGGREGIVAELGRVGGGEGSSSGAGAGNTGGSHGRERREGRGAEAEERVGTGPDLRRMIP
jgi:hypothetical protein